jgi:hypothetical protein
VFAVEPQHSHTVDRLEWIAAHPDRANVAKLFDVLAMPFPIGGVLVYVLLSRQRSPRLAYAGGILLGSGMVGLSMIQGFETLAFGLTEDGRFDLKALPDKVDNLTVALGSRTPGRRGPAADLPRRRHRPPAGTAGTPDRARRRGVDRVRGAACAAGRQRAGFGRLMIS